MMNEKKEKKKIDDESLDQVTGGRLGGGNEKVPYWHCNAEGCGHRWIPQHAGHTTTQCPKCGSTDITKE